MPIVPGTAATSSTRSDVELRLITPTDPEGSFLVRVCYGMASGAVAHPARRAGGRQPPPSWTPGRGLTPPARPHHHTPPDRHPLVRPLFHVAVLALAPLGVLVVNRRRHDFPSQAVSNYGPTVRFPRRTNRPSRTPCQVVLRPERVQDHSERWYAGTPSARYARSETTPEVREVRTRVASYFVRIQVP